MKFKIFLSILITYVLLSVILYLNNGWQTDAVKSGLGITGPVMYARGSAQDPKPIADISPQKWQKMIATDIGSLQKGSTGKDTKGTVYAVSVHPQGETGDIGETDEIAITFSEPVAPLQKVVKNQSTLIQTLPYLKGEGYWKSSTTYAYRIDEPRKLSSLYKVRFKGYTAFTGKQVQGKEWSFTTPTITIIDSKPYHEEKWQTLDQKVLVQFSQDVDPEKISNYIKIESPQGSASFSTRYCTKEERKILYYDAENESNLKRFVT
ncbi:MAG TPA: hypothetical protein VK469_15295, partial [Candidatus Kapabacteria bacterium]|nr:hypothetical protein [Candidatus Kapabacteria bacterium]